MSGYRLIFSLLFILLFSFSVFAGGEKGGDITFEWITGKTYQFKVCHYSEEDAVPLQEIILNYGDGYSDTILMEHDTVINQMRKRIFKGTHTYTGDGTFIVCYSANNWKFGINNQFGNYVFKNFCQITINTTFAFGNSSAQFNSTHFDFTYWAGLITHNLQAFDPDGDSLVYDLRPIILNCNQFAIIPGEYQYPQFVGGGSCLVNQVGILQMALFNSGYYTLCIQISEYRNGQLLSRVFRQILFPANPNGIEENPEQSLKIYPNPCSDQMLIQSSTELEMYAVWDVSGRIMKTLFLESTNEVIPVNELPSGPYWIGPLNHAKAKKAFIKY